MTKTLQEACADEDFELVNKIIETSPFMVEALYEDIRLASFTNVKNRHKFNEICNQLKLKIKSKASANVRLPSVKTEFRMNLTQGWVNLFHEGKPRDCKQSKEIAIKNILVKFYLLLLSPTKCIPYLNHLSSELDRYIREVTGHASEIVDPNSYIIAPMGGHYFPVPNQHFVDPAKHNFLKEFLSSILKAQGLGENAYTWVGEIPSATAKDMMKSGNLCVDSGFGSQLLHGMKSHSLQLAIFCLYMAELNPRYRQDGEMIPITLLEIVTSLCKIRAANGGSILKHMMDDTGLDIFSFTEPEQLNSYLLTEKANSNIDTLRNVMLAARCKKFNKILALYNHLFYTDDPISVDEFINEVDLIVTPLMITAPIFTEEAIKSKMKKGHRLIEMGVDGHLPYAIFQNDIEPNPTFIPQLTIPIDHQSSQEDIPINPVSADVGALSRVNSGISLFRSVAQEFTVVSQHASDAVESLPISSAALAAAPPNRLL